MKLLFGIFLFFLFSCGHDRKKIYIQSVQTQSDSRFDWYFYSLLTNFSRSYIQIQEKNNDPTTFFESFYMSEMKIKADTLIISLFRNDYEIDSSFINSLDFKISIDTTGEIWNQASSRLGRLNGKNVDNTKPHFADTYCARPDCDE